MSRTPSEVVREQFEAVNRGDFEAATDIWADDAVLIQSGDWLNAGTYEGKAEELHDSFDAALAATGIQDRGDANG